MNKIYPTDLTDTRWNTIVHLLGKTRKRKHRLKEILNSYSESYDAIGYD
jgi:hypothetical protein